jgi:pyridoxine/pyridoxamine 5'-phosphate oxidase
VDDEGKVVISTREAASKTRDLRRDPTAVLCVLSDDLFGRWMQLEGTAQIVSQPEAMPASQSRPSRRRLDRRPPPAGAMSR